MGQGSRNDISETAGKVASGALAIVVSIGTSVIAVALSYISLREWAIATWEQGWKPFAAWSIAAVVLGGAMAVCACSAAYRNASRKRIEELEEKLEGAEADAAENKRLLEDLRSNVALYAAARGKDVDEFIREAVDRAVAENAPKVDEQKLIDQAVRKVEEKRERQENPRCRKYRNLQAEREYKAEKRKKRGW